MANTPARVADPDLQQKVYNLTSKKTAAALVAIRDKLKLTFPSKTLLETAYFENNLTQEDKTLEIQRMVRTYAVEIGHDGDAYDRTFPARLAQFDHYVIEFDVAFRAYARAGNLRPDEASIALAASGNCRRDLIDCVRTKTLLPIATCQRVLGKMAKVSGFEPTACVVRRADNNEGYATPKDRLLRKIVMDDEFPGRSDFAQKLSKPGENRGSLVAAAK